MIKMKYILRTLLLSLVVLFVTQKSFAEEQQNVNSQNLKASAAGCSAGGSFAFLDINNIRARINTGGDMWWNFDRAEYYVPANTQQTSMFSASLWIGGLDVNGQLKLAAQRYRQVGIDYWPGPLSRIDASVDEETCAQYDRMFEISRAEVDAFLAWTTSANPSEEFPDYTIPESILNWPAHGDEALGQSYYMAPFYDNDMDGNYDPRAGDYPYYDIDNSLCKSLTPTMDADYYYADDEDNWKFGILADQVIKGDQTLWWVFNDKGNVHTETSGAAIGMEIRAQAFGFATNDEVNNMTFYSYEIINRSTFKLTETYFSQWVDTDLGYAWDDYVGCDVARGLGYCYNGTSIDGSGEVEAYGEQPPAIGVDFFQGPYMDPDGNDNPKYQYVTNAQGDTIDEIQICDVSINGVNFGDGITDNERFGMRRFVYHNNTSSNPNTTDPQTAPEYYNYLRGIWKDNTKMLYGGTAHTNDPKAVGPECDFMFPGDTDPCNWGTGGTPPNDGFNQSGKYWTEETEQNQPGDRRFMQSAGPFDLEPGAVNYITVGIPWARATSGGAWASVLLLRVVDDKAQALFDNCFKVLDGPSAPDLTFLEQDRKMVVTISNRKGSNNYLEAYSEIDPNIQLLEDTTGTRTEEQEDSLKTYRFEGYQIYQLRRADVSVESLDDPDLARLVAQFDKKNGVTKLINYYFDRGVGANVPVVEVEGGDEGIRHTFEIKQDAFADKDPKLINHKQYYYVALAYAFNEYLPYSQDPGIEDGLYGQKLPYLSGRKNIKVYTAIPHKPVNGLEANSVYGDRFEITRIQGNGNGGFDLELKESTVDEILSKPPITYQKDSPSGGYYTNDTMGSENYPIAYTAEYVKNFGPLNVKVVDPLDMVSGEYTLRFTDVKQPGNTNEQGEFVVTDSLTILDANWILSDGAGNTWESDTSISLRNEQVIPELGISIDIERTPEPGSSAAQDNGLINFSLTFEDSSQFWYSGVPDFDIPASPLNWIRSGVYKDDANTQFNDWRMSLDQPWDAGQNYERIIGGTWAPYALTADKDEISVGPAYNFLSRDKAKLKFLASIDVVLTADKSKWTRCPVLETSPDKNLSQGGAEMLRLRESPSIDKDGNFAASMDMDDSNNPDDPNYISAKGMGWFPGYVINVETGERLNVMYGENSWLSGDNGRDMQWNPSNRITDNSGNPVFGGMHYLYVLNSTTINYVGNLFHIPAYDAGRYFRDSLVGVGISNGGLPDNVRLSGLFASVNWVNIPRMADSVWLPEGNDARIRIRVTKPYKRYFSQTAAPVNSPVKQNDYFPMYSFNTAGLEAVKFSAEKNNSDLDMINVVPNPYYAYADGPGYERNQLDTRVKITNIPEQCVVTIYNINGTLIRQYKVDKSGVSNPSSSIRGVESDARTSIDWDLKNFAGIPIAGGLYLIHVKETGGRNGERVVKWFGAMRPVDLNTF
jgi:hypothetical protein